MRRHDGMVTWEGFECSQGLQIEGTGVYRINGNLAVARAIGDVDYRPWVSGEEVCRRSACRSVVGLSACVRVPMVLRVLAGNYLVGLDFL